MSDLVRSVVEETSPVALLWREDWSLVGTRGRTEPRYLFGEDVNDVRFATGAEITPLADFQKTALYPAGMEYEATVWFKFGRPGRSGYGFILVRTLEEAHAYCDEKLSAFAKEDAS